MKEIIFFDRDGRIISRNEFYGEPENLLEIRFNEGFLFRAVMFIIRDIKKD